MRGFASTLDARWDKLTDAERRSAVHTIAERARSLGQLMDHLLLGARAGAEELTVRIEASTSAERVRAATLGPAGAVRAASGRGGTSPRTCRLVSGDALATDILLGQLLENAFKYSPDGGLIRVEAWPRTATGGRWSSTTRASASPRPDREHVFERFVQVDSGDRRRFGGVGLGLYIVRSLAGPRAARCRRTRVPPEAPGCGWPCALPTRPAPLPNPTRRCGNEVGHG